MYATKTLKEIKSTLKKSINKQNKIEQMLQDEIRNRKAILNDYMNTQQFKSELKHWVLQNKKMIIGIYLFTRVTEEMFYINDEDILEMLGYAIDPYTEYFPRNVCIYLKDIEKKQYYKYSLSTLCECYANFVRHNKECVFKIPELNYTLSMCYTVKEFTIENSYQSYITTKEELDCYKLCEEVDKMFEIQLFDPDLFEVYYLNDELEEYGYEDYEAFKEEENPIEAKWESEGYELCFDW